MNDQNKKSQDALEVGKTLLNWKTEPYSTAEKSEDFPDLPVAAPSFGPPEESAAPLPKTVVNSGKSTIIGMAVPTIAPEDTEPASHPRETPENRFPTHSQAGYGLAQNSPLLNNAAFPEPETIEELRAFFQIGQQEKGGSHEEQSETNRRVLTNDIVEAFDFGIDRPSPASAETFRDVEVNALPPETDYETGYNDRSPSLAVEAEVFGDIDIDTFEPDANAMDEEPTMAAPGTAADLAAALEAESAEESNVQIESSAQSTDITKTIPAIADENTSEVNMSDDDSANEVAPSSEPDSTQGFIQTDTTSSYPPARASRAPVTSRKKKKKMKRAQSRSNAPESALKEAEATILPVQKVLPVSPNKAASQPAVSREKASKSPGGKAIGLLLAAAAVAAIGFLVFRNQPAVNSDASNQLPPPADPIVRTSADLTIERHPDATMTPKEVKPAPIPVAAVPAVSPTSSPAADETVEPAASRSVPKAVPTKANSSVTTDTLKLAAVPAEIKPAATPAVPAQKNTGSPTAMTFPARFNVGSAVFSFLDKDEEKAFVRELRAKAEGRQVVIRGYVTPQEKIEKKGRIASSRAWAVQKYLQRRGIQPQLIQAGRGILTLPLPTERTELATISFEEIPQAE